MTTPLFPLNHPTYLRRLVRELNGQLNGFYYGGTRYSRVRLVSGKMLQARQVTGTGEVWDRINTLSPITDAYGRDIVVSRRASR